MGWTFGQDWRRKQDVVNYLTREFGSKVVAQASAGRAAYFALRETDAPDAPVYGLVAILERASDGWCGYKLVDEFSGPVDTQCPASVLNALSPLDTFTGPSEESRQWAEAWRAKCRTRAISDGTRRVWLRGLTPGAQVQVPTAAGDKVFTVERVDRQSLLVRSASQRGWVTKARVYPVPQEVR
jgi:hypothetical protein